MSENVLGGKAGKVKPHPVRQKAETRGGKLLAALAHEHRIELGPQRVEIEHIGGGVRHLRVAQLGGAPIGHLLLLGKFVAEDLAHQVLETMLVGIGARQARRDLGAIDRRRHDAECFVEHAEIEPREVKDFQNARVGEQPLEVGRIGGGRGDLHHVGGAVAGRKLHQTQPVAAKIESHRLGVDRDRAAIARDVRQVAAVLADGHEKMSAAFGLAMVPRREGTKATPVNSLSCPTVSNVPLSLNAYFRDCPTSRSLGYCAIFEP